MRRGRVWFAAVALLIACGNSAAKAPAPPATTTTTQPNLEKLRAGTAAVVVKRLRCSKGHEWTLDQWGRATPPGGGVVQWRDGKNYCAVCLEETLGKLGDVEEVAP